MLVEVNDFKCILPRRDFQDYQSTYIDLYQKYKKSDEGGDKEIINEDVVFEIELIKQVEVNIDYILMQVEKYQKSGCIDTKTLSDINKAINSSIQLRSKKELIENFIDQVNLSTKINLDWRKYINKCKEEDITAIIEEEDLKSKETRRFLNNSFRDGSLKTTGTAVDGILPPVSRFGGGRAAKKRAVINKLLSFFEKYSGLV